MNRADLSDKPRPEPHKDKVDLYEGLPKKPYVMGIIALVHLIFFKRYGRNDLIGFGMDAHIDLHPLKHGKDLLVKIGDRPRVKVGTLGGTLAGKDDQLMPHKIEVDLEDAACIRHAARRQPARRDIERDMPGMIEPGHLPQPYLADDLRPKMNGSDRILQTFILQLRPRQIRTLHNLKMKTPVRGFERN